MFTIDQFIIELNDKKKKTKNNVTLELLVPVIETALDNF